MNPRNFKGNTPEGDEMERCKKLRYRRHWKKFLKKFNKEFGSFTFSKHGFSIGRRVLNVNSLKHKAKSL
jgi:hypothetical protein